VSKSHRQRKEKLTGEAMAEKKVPGISNQQKSSKAYDICASLGLKEAGGILIWFVFLFKASLEWFSR